MINGIYIQLLLFISNKMYWSAHILSESRTPWERELTATRQEPGQQDLHRQGSASGDRGLVARLRGSEMQ